MRVVSPWLSTHVICALIRSSISLGDRRTPATWLIAHIIQNFNYASSRNTNSCHKITKFWERKHINYIWFLNLKNLCITSFLYCHLAHFALHYQILDDLTHHITYQFFNVNQVFLSFTSFFEWKICKSFYYSISPHYIL